MRFGVNKLIAKFTEKKIILYLKIEEEKLFKVL